MSEPSGWSRGYPVNETYPSSWHSFQSPAHLRVICALAGVAWEVGPDTPLSILEVGCGAGYNSQMLAAGNSDWQVMGLDYNPAHIAEARSMASAAGLDNVRFVEADLAELDDATLDSWPEFDLVTVHGVWSWVAEPVREGVLRLLRRRLKPGGIALVSYNAMPGAAGALGLARLVRASMLAAGNSTDGVALATQQVQALMAAEVAHLPPSSWRRLLTGEIKGARAGYLLHEFQTEHWRPSFHADVAAALGTARCEYVGSASIDENFPQMSLTPAQRALWEAAPDSNARELIFDLSVQRAFRRDVYVRGLRRVPREATTDALWLAAASHAQGNVVLKAQAGEATLPAALIDAVRTALAQGPCRIASLRALPACSQVTAAELAAMLVGSGCAVPLWCEPGAGPRWAAAQAAARRFSAVSARRLAPHGVGGGTLGLPSPALGGGLTAGALELAVVGLLNEPGGIAPSEASASTLIPRLLPPGPGPGAEVLEELQRVVTLLLQERRPVWQALGIV